MNIKKETEKLNKISQEFKVIGKVLEKAKAEGRKKLRKGEIKEALKKHEL